MSLLTEAAHYQVLARNQERALRPIDRRFFESQLVGVNLKGVY